MKFEKASDRRKMIEEMKANESEEQKIKDKEFNLFMQKKYPDLKSGRQRPRNADERKVLDRWADSEKELEKIQARDVRNKE